MLALTVLASGSQANCTALTVGAAGSERLLLIDAGLSPRASRERLFPALGRPPEDVTDLLLTHLDADHYREGWNRIIRRHGIRVHLHPAHIAEARRLGIPEESMLPLDGSRSLGDGLVVRPIRVPHDDRGATAFVFEWSAEDTVARVGFATDLGRVPDALHQAFQDLDALAIESNYDPAMQEASPRPAFLKARIMGGRGHLSNEESLLAARRISAGSDLRAIVLLHLSRQCNCPNLVTRLWRDEAPDLVDRVVVSEQFRCASTVRIAPRARRCAPEIPAGLFDEAERMAAYAPSPA